MKYPLMLMLVMTANFAYSQNTKNVKPPLTLYTNESGSYVYDTVITVNDASKGELYKRAKNWVTSNVRSVDNTLQFNDKDSSEIRTDVTFALTINYINFKMALLFKDGKCRMSCSSFLEVMNMQTMEKPLEKVGAKWVSKELDEKFSAMKNSLIKSLNKKGSDW